MVYVMLTEDNSIDDKNYHLLPINYADLGSDYKFTGEFFDKKSNSKFKFPIVEGKFTQPDVTSLKEFNDYMKNVEKLEIAIKK